MTTRAIFRKAALTFPDVVEEVRAREVAYTVHGRPFASLTEEGTAKLRLPVAAAEEAIAAYPSAETLSHAGRAVGFQAPLADIDGQHLWALVMAAWKHRAPRRLAAQLDAIESSPSQPGSDLPRGIGKAATRALATAGITTLEQVAARPRSELLAMHGVGPKAIRILDETLEEQGQPWHG